jgi:hypothetical protein
VTEPHHLVAIENLLWAMWQQVAATTAVTHLIHVASRIILLVPLLACLGPFSD